MAEPVSLIPPVDLYAVLVRRNVQSCPTCGHSTEKDPTVVEGLPRYQVKVTSAMKPDQIDLVLDREVEWTNLPCEVHGWGLADEEGHLLWYSWRVALRGDTFWIRRDR